MDSSNAFSNTRQPDDDETERHLVGNSEVEIGDDGQGLPEDNVNGDEAMGQASASSPHVLLPSRWSNITSGETHTVCLGENPAMKSDYLEMQFDVSMVETSDRSGDKRMDEPEDKASNVCDMMDAWRRTEECVVGEMLSEENRAAFDEETHPYTDGLYLDDLDDDVLLHIASFLEARVVKYALSRVCVRFRDMFDNEAYWKTRTMKRWPKKYPAVPALPDFTWLDACVEREDSHRVWSDPAANTRHFLYSCNLYAEVDSVHLMQRGRLLLSGDRNRNMNVIDLDKYDHDLEGAQREANFKDMLVHSDSATHKGWIWCMTSVDNCLVTGSWDTHIRLFDVSSQLMPSHSYKCKSAVLSLLAEENQIMASCFDKKVYFIDRRSSDIRSRNFHKQPVLAVAGNERFVISGSEDKTISIFDRRQEKIMTRMTLDNYPLGMCFRDNHLWVGDKRGLLHLYDGGQGLFSHVGTYDVGHVDKVTGVVSTRGALFTCSGDSTVKVHTPSQEPDLIASLDDHKKQIAWLDYSHGVLASAGGEDIGVWLPKHWDTDTYLL